MFEKEAEEYATRECCATCNNINHFCKEKCECWTFAKKGAEFGYNKANEWHYPSKGEYPKVEKKVLCILGDFENDNLEVGYYSQVEGDSKRWRFEDYDLPDDSEEGWGVSAWKEIVLPELPKNCQRKNAELKDKLIKAKGLLSKLLEEEKNNMYWEMNSSDKSSYYEVRKQAEQFLKKVK